MNGYLCMMRHFLVGQALLLFLVAGAARSDVDKVPNQTQFSEATLDRMFQGSLNKQKIATEYVLQHPDTVQPFDYAYMIKALWVEGNRSRATFWSYVFQSRSLAWAKADKVGNGPAAVRASLNQVLGQTINQWVGRGSVTETKTMGMEVVSGRRAMTASVA
jgi:hypothetical protein